MLRHLSSHPDAILRRVLRNPPRAKPGVKGAFRAARSLVRLRRKHPQSHKLQRLMFVHVPHHLCLAGERTAPHEPLRWPHAEAIVRAGLARSLPGWGDERTEIRVLAGGYQPRWERKNGEHGPIDYASPLVVAYAWRPHPRPSRWATELAIAVLAGRDEGKQPFAIPIPDRAIQRGRIIRSAAEWVRPKGWRRADILIRQGDVFALGRTCRTSRTAARHEVVLQHPEHEPIALPNGYIWWFGAAREHRTKWIRPTID